MEDRIEKTPAYYEELFNAAFEQYEADERRTHNRQRFVIYLIETGKLDIIGDTTPTNDTIPQENPLSERLEEKKPFWATDESIGGV